jgi:uncharacterized protein YjdB
MKLKKKMISGVLAIAMVFGLLVAVPTNVKAETIAEQATETLTINEFDMVTVGESAIVYKIKVKQSGTLELKFSQTWLADVSYEWYNEGGALIDSQRHNGTYCLSATLSNVSAGTYYFRLWGLNSEHYGDYVCYSDFTPDTSSSLELGISLVKGKTVQLSGMFENCTDKELTWKSSNTKIATVSKSGKVTAKKKGTVTIKAFNKSGLVAKIKIKVTTK